MAVTDSGYYYVLAISWGGLIATLVYLSDWYLYLSQQPKILTLIALSLSEAYAGMGFILLFVLTNTLTSIASNPNLSVYPDVSSFGIKGLGKIILKIWIGVLLVWIIFQFVGIFASNSLGTAAYFESYAITCIGYPSLIAIVLSFTLCILPWNERIMQYKKQKYIELHSELNITNHMQQSPTIKDTNEAGIIDKEIERLDQLPSWPLSAKDGFFGFIATLLAQYPVVESLIKFTNKIFLH